MTTKEAHAGPQTKEKGGFLPLIVLVVDSLVVETTARDSHRIGFRRGALASLLVVTSLEIPFIPSALSPRGS